MKRAKRRVVRPASPDATLTPTQMNVVVGGFDGLNAKADVVGATPAPVQK